MYWMGNKENSFPINTLIWSPADADTEKQNVTHHFGGGGWEHKDYVIFMCLEINSVFVWGIFQKLYLVQILKKSCIIPMQCTASLNTYNNNKLEGTSGPQIKVRNRKSLF